MPRYFFEASGPVGVKGGLPDRSYEALEFLWAAWSLVRGVYGLGAPAVM
jgi:hypothetical protein